MHGYVLVDKPVGPSSHATVQRVKRALRLGGRRGTKAGHAGTLDPGASGLLVVLIGRATRLMPYVVGHDKRYLVEVRFGASSSTDDAAGDLVEHPDAPRPSQAAVIDALDTLRASTRQVPPAVSAIHIDGERAYQRVRRGETVVVPERPVRFDRIELVEWARDGSRAVLDVRSGSGAYMRALARDLGDLVECPAHCGALRRLEVGDWTLDDAPDAAELTVDHLRDAIDLVGPLERVQLNGATLVQVARGQSLEAATLRSQEGADVALVAPDGTLAAVGFVEAGRVRPRTVLVDPVPHGVASSRS